DGAAPVGKVGEEPLEGLHSLNEPFRVVEPVNADHQRAIAQALHHVANESGPDRAPAEPLELADFDADRKASDTGLPAVVAEHDLMLGRLENPRIPVAAAILGNDVADEIPE